MEMIVLSPVGEPTLDIGKLALPLDDLAGKVIGILNDGFGATVPDTLATFERLVKERFPGTSAKHWVKPNLSAPAPQWMIDEITNTVDAVIVGVAA